MSSQSVIPTCYRHPDRETRLACSNCERAVCVDCVRPAPVGQRCLECVAPDQRQRVLDMDDVRRQSDRMPPVTLAILVASIGVFVLSFVSPELAVLIGTIGEQDNADIARGEWWRVLSAAFLHSGVMHLGFNMYALYLFGPPLEREVGSAPFAVMYAASAIAGGAAFYLLVPGADAVGASGAIFGLFGAWIVASYRGRHTVQGQANLRQLLTLLGLNLLIGFIPGARIAWQAHLGGLIAGGLIAALWALPVMRNRPLQRTIAAAAVGVSTLLLVL